MTSIHVAISCVLLALIPAISSHAQDQPSQLTKPVQQPSLDKVAAVVNGENILAAEVSAEVQRQLQGRSVSPEVARQLHNQSLLYIINWRIVEQLLKKNNIHVDTKKVDSIMDDVKRKTEDAGLTLEDSLRRQGHTESSFRRRIEGQLAFQKFAGDRITDQKLQKYFEGRKQDFDGTEVRASHVLIKLDRTATKEMVDEAVAKVKSIRGEIVNGLQFADAAKKYSQGPSGPKGGDVGFFPRHDKMVEPFAKAAFNLKKGEISEPVATQFGIHLIQITDRKPGTDQLADVRDKVKSFMTRHLWETIATQGQKDAKISINTPDQSHAE